MISSVRSNMPSFKAVEFTPGFNVILADRTKESTRGDSRNGLGKTTLFEIVHFCLGAQTRRNQGLLVAPLKGWTFTLEVQIELKIENLSLAVTRSIDEPNRVQLRGDVDDLADVGELQNGGLSVRIGRHPIGIPFLGQLSWAKNFLGSAWKNLSPNTSRHSEAYSPTSFAVTGMRFRRPSTITGAKENGTNRSITLSSWT